MTRAAVALGLVLALAVAPGFARAAARPTYGGAARVAIPGPVRALDPALAETPQDVLLASLVHQPPLARDDAGALRPVLLTALPASDDGGRTFTLHVRAGLSFHDGSPLRPADVAATIRRLGDPRLRSPHAALVLPVRGIEVRGDDVIVQLAFPYPGWTQALAEPAFGVLPAELRSGRPPPGAGPFRLQGAPAAGEPATLVAFEGHAEGRPFLDALTLTPMTETRARRLLETGVADLALLPGAGGHASAAELALGPASPPSLRAALETALSRADLTRWFVPGGATPLTSLLPPSLDEASPAPAHGGELPRDLSLQLAFDPDAPGHRAVAERIQLRLHDRGITVHLDPRSGAELRAIVAAGRHELSLLQVPLAGDPGLAAAALLLAGGRQEEALALLSRAGSAAANGALAAVRAEAHRLAAGPVVPLWIAGATLATSPRTPLHLPQDLSLAAAWRPREPGDLR